MTPMRNSYRHAAGPRYSGAKNGVEAATLLNAQYARTFTQRIAEMAQYLSWQQERVTNWKLAPLVPVISRSLQAHQHHLFGTEGNSYEVTFFETLETLIEGEYNRSPLKQIE